MNRRDWAALALTVLGVGLLIHSLITGSLVTNIISVAICVPLTFERWRAVLRERRAERKDEL